MLRSRSHPAISVLAFAALLPACSPKPPAGPIEFTLPPLGLGDTVRTTVVSSFKNGSFSATSPDAEATGSISIERSRIVRTTVTATGEDGPTECTLVVPEDTATVTLLSGEGSRIDSLEGPLNGIPLRATRDGEAWSVALADRVAEPEQAEALLALEIFENRRWFPGRPVDLGDSWDFEPVFLRSLVERDLGTAAANGRMTLRALENHPDGAAQARFDLEITTSGTESPADAADRSLTRRAAIEARGTLVVDLETMLDRELIIEGTIRSGAADNTSEASLELPLHIEVRREILPRP